ncbi:MAG TPA: MCP four helix bundle domain-containing protein [Candidatus Brocadiaceae bacterium]|nr:MAG: hypothetical protein A2Y09_07780 [Planctomycetes bacterium GWA2_39_15]
MNKGDLEGVKTRLVEGRTALLSMLDEKDKAKQAEYNAKIKKVTAEINTMIPSMVEKEKGTACEGKLNELKEAWVIFRDGRDNNVIPALLAGRVDEAKAIGTGIQKERFARVNSIVDGLLAQT